MAKSTRWRAVRRSSLHRERRITAHARAVGGAWETRGAAKGGEAMVASLGVHLNVDDVYRHSAIR